MVAWLQGEDPLGDVLCDTIWDIERSLSCRDIR